ncbi:SPOR domain-containing protein [Ensifer soli]|uniref:SPOR domain-containing protein n=1 Tax=Ciceribacter sp. sgz301302 TaxID=3342379 RepID=UPI0035BB713D
MSMKSNRVFPSMPFPSATSSCRAIAKVAGRFVIAGFLGIAAVTAATGAAANPKYAGIVVDAKTGKVLYGDSADELRYPASLTKMMTLYLTFEALEAGKIRKTTKVPFSKHAASEPPSKLGVGAGKAITVEEAILSLVTRSANDSATALGEMLGGSEPRFARMMTNKARALGMTRTTYRNANGLPDPAQMTTARDQARLGLALRQHFPQYYDYFSTRSFRFGKNVIGNHNRLLGNVRGVDGIKTGYTRASGFNLATSAEADGRSIVAVVLGGTSGGARDAQMRKLVATYMPAASTRGKSGVKIQAPPVEMVSARQAPVEEIVETETAAVAGFSLPENGPVPGARYVGESAEVEVAYASAAPRSENPLVKRKPAPAGTLDAQHEAIEAMAPSVDAQITNSVAKAAPSGAVGGWVIQIGATPTEGQAMALLAVAQKKAGGTLNEAKPFAVAFGDIYRARFGGFGSQSQATTACKALTKRGFSCWATQQ